MKKTKKLLACLIAAATMFTMGSTAFAETETTPTDQETVTIHKQYKLIGQGTSPAETFTLAQVGDGKVTDGDADNAPHLGTITGAAFAKGAATGNGTIGDIKVALPEYTHVGVYEYTLHEADGNNVGVTYYGNNIKLVVTVIQGENKKLRIAAVHAEAENGAKSDTFENTYSANSLPVKKLVTGNLGDKDKLFNVTVTLTNNTGKTMASDISYTAGGEEKIIKASDWNDNTVTRTIQLKHDQTITFTNLPFGVEYVVTEDDYSNIGYDAPNYDYKNTDKKINIADQSVTITNNKNSDNIDTGVNLTTLPYILVFAGVIVIAGAAFITRRRKFED